jgi:hypothetical protein
MTQFDEPQKSTWLKVLRRIFTFTKSLLLVVLVAWGALSLYYSNAPWPTVRLIMAVLFAVAGIWAVWFSRGRTPKLVFTALFLLVTIWYVLIPPSHLRDWRLDVSVMPRAMIDGDLVTLTGFRNFDFKGRNEFVSRFEERVVNLSDVTSVDFFISYWSKGPVGHTFVSFNFKNSPPVSISIETRPEANEGYDPVGSIFKLYELIYVIGDERDIVRWRTNYRNEEVFLYRINASPQQARLLFEIYLERINELYDKPEWYHLFKNNCGLNIIRYANAAGREGGFNIRHLLNGWMDRYFYSVGLIDNTLPFSELRQKSHINKAAIAAQHNPEFSMAIRESLPGMK